MTMLNRFMPILLIFIALLLTGCEDEEAKRTYDTNFNEAYQKAIKDGEKLGEKNGQEIGFAAAEKAAIDGTAWQLYYYLTLGSLLSGLSLGLIIQYGILWRCRRTSVLPQLSTMAFVPAMKLTTAYSIFLHKRNLKIKVDEELSELAARKNIQIAKIEQLKKEMTMKIEAISSIDELTQSRILELAKEEIEKIVKQAKEKQKVNWDNMSDDDILEL